MAELTGMRTLAGFLLLIGSGIAQQETTAPQPAAGDSVDIAARTAELYERSFRELLRCLDGVEEGWVQLPSVDGVPIEEADGSGRRCAGSATWWSRRHRSRCRG